MSEQLAERIAAIAVKSITERLEKYSIPPEAMDVIELGIRTAVSAGISAFESVNVHNDGQ